MSSPLPLRLWCLAAMAPALTEAAPQARVKPSETSTPSTLPLVNGRSLTPQPDTGSATLKTPLPDPARSHEPVTLSKVPSPGPVPDLRATVPLQPLLGIIRQASAQLPKSGLVVPQQSLLSAVCGAVGKGMNCTSGAGEGPLRNGSSRPVTGIHVNGSTIKAPTMGFTKAPPQKPATYTPSVPTTSATIDSMNEDSLHVQEASESMAVTTEVQPVSSGMADVGVLMNVDLVAETLRRQQEMERKLDRLMRRLRRLQSRQVVSHVKDQLGSFVEHQHSNLQTIARSMKTPPANVDLKSGLLQKEDVKNLSTAALVSLVQRLQSSQSTMSLRQRLSSQNSAPPGGSVLKLNEDHCREMSRVSATLQMNLHHLERAVDSDATESSSGGESCDEDYDYDDEKISRPPVNRRCDWRYGSERAAVASRWTWLQAQVSDLEYRIRQQTEIYRQIRAAKGTVVLGDAPPPHDLLVKRTGRKLTPLEEKIASLERKNTEMSPCPLTTLIHNVDKQSTRLTQQLGNVYSPLAASRLAPPKTPGTPNGLVDPLAVPHTNSATPENSDNEMSEDLKRCRTNGPTALHFDPPSPVVDNSCTAARCRPVKSYGKRKLLRTAGLHQVSRKAARLATVRCGCYPPTTPCALCGGRFNNTQTIDTQWMPMSERVAILDPSFHPVLSFKGDVPLTLHFESLLKTGDWQHKPVPSRLLKPLPLPTRRTGKREYVRKYNKRLSKSASAAFLSSKIKSKYEQKPRMLSAGALAKLDGVTLKRGSLRKNRRSMPTITSSNGTSSGTSTPTLAGETLSSSWSSSTLKEMKDSLRRRRGESAFDINNIVIPYSMAAATRVEKLQYKEILTPKWRELTAEELEHLRKYVINQVQQQSTMAQSAVEEVNMRPATPPVEPPVTSSEPAEDQPTVPSDGQTENTEESEAEDISDECFAERHMRCEISERKRFSAAVNKKRAVRGTRSDSMGSLLSVPTPGSDSAPPDFETAVAMSAVQTPPGTPASLDLPVGEEPRKRSGSVSSRGDSRRVRTGSICLSERGESTEVYVSPWERRNFPLRDDDFAQLQSDPQEEPVRTSPALHPALRACRVQTMEAAEANPAGTSTPSSIPQSPNPSSASSDIAPDEDPDDPEWTVIGGEPPKPKLPSIVLKLAKR